MRRVIIILCVSAALLVIALWVISFSTDNRRMKLIGSAIGSAPPSRVLLDCWVWRGRLTLTHFHPVSQVSSIRGMTFTPPGFHFVIGGYGGMKIIFIDIKLWVLFLGCLVYPAFVIHNHFRLLRYRRQAGLCIYCGYNLTGNTSGICPECGERI
jgi:hypothetical protein